MARRGIEKIFGELGEIRRMLADPHAGITALHQVQVGRHSKVLEHVTCSTTGVREENRELSRRQERMLSDLGQVRTAADDLRREIAQAWAHTLGRSHIPGTTEAAEDVLPARQAPAMEAGPAPTTKGRTTHPQSTTRTWRPSPSYATRPPGRLVSPGSPASCATGPSPDPRPSSVVRRATAAPG